MAIISVAISLSLTKIYADKHGYEVDANQVVNFSEKNFCLVIVHAGEKWYRTYYRYPNELGESSKNTCPSELSVMPNISFYL